MPINSFAEDWLCVYVFNGESLPVHLKRNDNNNFIDIETQNTFSIINESDNVVHLYGQGTESDELAGLIHLDKKNLKIQMVSLGINYTSEIIKGKCNVF